MLIKLIGDIVILEEVSPKYFDYIIRWRNDEENNRFLNQPFSLNLERQKQWYHHYTQDNTQGLLIMIDKQSHEPFGTVGWTNLDLNLKRGISGRLLVGNHKYNASKQLIEGMILHSDYMHEALGLEEIYVHVVKENKKTISFNKKLGYQENLNECKYPKELFVNGMNQIELFRKKNDYYIARNKILKLIRKS